MLREVGGWIQVRAPSREGNELQVLARRGHEATQRAIPGIPVAALVCGHDGLRRAGALGQVALCQPGAEADGFEKLGWAHAETISYCL